MGRARLVVYLLLIALIFLPWLAWEKDRNMVRRWLYPVRAHLAAWSTDCNARTAPWLKELARRLPTQLDSPANQLVFVDSTGKQASCVNGWKGLPLVSGRVTDDTRFRLASLSKLVAFMGLTHEKAEPRSAWLDVPLVQALSISPPFKDKRISQIRIRQLLNHSAGFDRLQAEDPMVVRNKKPWCPEDVSQLAQIPLQFAPGERYAYANLDYCLASVAYQRRFGHSLWDALEQGLHISRYGLDYLDRADSPVEYNFMHNEFYGPDFVRYFDWTALRASMGMTGNAQGLARFVIDHRPLLDLAREMRDNSIRCDETKPENCQDGFLERRRVGSTQIWVQRGYLYGMSALFLMDATGNFLIWLGAGDMNPPLLAYEYVEAGFLKALH
ncbi:class A beta-lactamase-related serine hydrolase [Variovorax guangxiensis]|uniref:Class A beta-lactamase-related serine hydrolase n=1 Tax=Variovorax guangxiensis TaxID=1775474 RepID=A0A3S0ZD23_9BURK|nr:class A beta-lactamase-related serine hydrolase [Variovorax guangxiensis]